MSQGHPRGLYVCFGAEMFERLCYYGMRGLLILYLTKALFQGDTRAIGIYGAYTALVYAAPVWGGKLILVVILAGFIPALIFAWAFELTPEGIKKEKDVDRSQSITHETGRKLNYVIIGALVVAVMTTRFGADSGWMKGPLDGEPLTTTQRSVPWCASIPSSSGNVSDVRAPLGRGRSTTSTKKRGGFASNSAMKRARSSLVRAHSSGAMMRMLSSASSSRTVSQMSECWAWSCSTRPRMRSSFWLAERPSGVGLLWPAATCCLRPDTRTWKNSSRLLAKMLRKRTRSSRGFRASSAW